MRLVRFRNNALYPLLSLLCIAVLVLLANLNRDQKYQSVTSISSKGANLSPTTSLNLNKLTLFEKYNMSALKILKPLEEPRPRFKILTAPNVAPQTPQWLNNVDVTLSAIVAIKSAHTSYARRQVIRNSWGLIGCIDGVRLHAIFVLAHPESPEDKEFVKEENNKFGDILEVDIKESYREVGLKVMASMQWVTDNFPNDWLYFSADDDIVPDLEIMLSNLKKLLKEATEHGQISKSLPIYCAFGFDEFPGVLRSGKWKVTREEYPHEFYPSICLGGFYGLTVRLSRAIYNASRHYPYFRHDDVFLTGFMRYVVCDSVGDEFYFKNDDPFCAISKIKNSNFEHVSGTDEYARHWNAKERKLVANKANIVKRPAG